jgi:hypothetical protein
MFGNIFWCDWVPAFIINFNASVILREEIIPFLVELFQYFLNRFLNLFIYQIISLWALIFVMRVRIVNEFFHCSLKNNNCFFLCYIVLMNFNIDTAWLILKNWQSLFVLLLIGLFEIRKLFLTSFSLLRLIWLLVIMNISLWVSIKLILPIVWVLKWLR